MKLEMIDHNLDGMTPQAKRKLLIEHIGSRATVQSFETLYRGILRRVTEKFVQVGSSQVHLQSIQTVRIHTGGDWASPREHGSAVKDAKINLRCRNVEKDFIARAAKRTNSKVNVIVIDAALEAASKVLGEKVPGRK